MPKVRPNQTEEASRVVRACVSGNMALHNISEEQLAVKMGERSAQSRTDVTNLETTRWRSCGWWQEH